MIVRDESAVIERCLDSVLPWIDVWAIVDTGSNDDTVERIVRKLGHLPGQLHTELWAGDFSLHRNSAVRLAREVTAAFQDLKLPVKILLIDADETLKVAQSEPFDSLIDTAVRISWFADDDGWRFRKLGIVDLSLVDQWQHPVHEELLLKPSHETVVPPSTALLLYGHDGARRAYPETSAQSDLTKMPDSRVDPDAKDSRKAFHDAFYSARTLEAGHAYVAAAAHFRAAAQSAHASHDERWQAVWGLARANEHIDIAEAARAHLRAYKADPMRAEPLLGLARIARMQAKSLEALALALAAAELSAPRDTAMYDTGAYSWQPLDEALFAAMAAMHMPVIRRISERFPAVLRDAHIPNGDRQRMLTNLQLANDLLDSHERPNDRSAK